MTLSTLSLAGTYIVLALLQPIPIWIFFLLVVDVLSACFGIWLLYRERRDFHENFMKEMATILAEIDPNQSDD